MLRPHFNKQWSMPFLICYTNQWSFFIDDFSTQSAKVALNLDKIFVAMQRGVLLGYVVFKNKREFDSEKVEVIMNLQPLLIVKEV